MNYFLIPSTDRFQAARHERITAQQLAHKKPGRPTLRYLRIA
jgi:hypothetical protein